MRHRVKGRKLGRTKPHREATLRALSSALIEEHRIKTTLPKAKELRSFIEPLITIAKEDNTHNRRKAFSSLQNKKAVKELFEEVGPAAADRPGGYTRVLKLGYRFGDSAQMAVIELVDFNDVQPEKKASTKKRTRRAGKSNKPTSSEADKEQDKKKSSEDSVENKKESKKTASKASEIKEEKAEQKSDSEKANKESDK